MARIGPWKMLARGITRRCAKCGAGKLFRRWLTMVDDCPGCGYHFEREEGFFLGAIVVNIILTEFTLILAIAIGFGLTLPDPPLVKLAAIAGVLGLVMPFLVYPFTKTMWTAVDMIMRRGLGSQFRDDRQPGFRSRP